MQFVTMEKQTVKWLYTQNWLINKSLKVVDINRAMKKHNNYYSINIITLKKLISKRREKNDITIVNYLYVCMYIYVIETDGAHL